jgi:hypothetical protein
MHDGTIGRVAARAQPPADLQAIDVRQVDVEDDETDVLVGLLEPSVPVTASITSNRAERRMRVVA